MTAAALAAFQGQCALQREAFFPARVTYAGTEYPAAFSGVRRKAKPNAGGMEWEQPATVRVRRVIPAAGSVAELRLAPVRGQRLRVAHGPGFATVDDLRIAEIVDNPATGEWILRLEDPDQ